MLGLHSRQCTPLINAAAAAAGYNHCWSLLQSGGTRGDVQPATALGVALAALGAHVAMATDASFEGFVQQHGLQHYTLGGNAREMMALTVKWG